MSRHRWFHFDLFGRKIGLTFGRCRPGFHRYSAPIGGWVLSYGLGIVRVL